VMQAYGRPTLLIDTNLDAVARARNQGLRAVQGNALEEEQLEDLDAEEYATVLATTSNPEVNVLACQLVRDAFGNNRAFPALSNPAKGANPGLLKQTGGRLAFGRFVDFAEWEEAGRVSRIGWVYPDSATASMAKDANIPLGMLPILRVRRNSAEIVHADQTWEAGDTIVFISTRPAEEARAVLEEAAGTTP
jgi:voltage-gated potassium channel Kch